MSFTQAQDYASTPSLRVHGDRRPRGTAAKSDHPQHLVSCPRARGSDRCAARRRRRTMADDPPEPPIRRKRTRGAPPAAKVKTEPAPQVGTGRLRRHAQADETPDDVEYKVPDKKPATKTIEEARREEALRGKKRRKKNLLLMPRPATKALTRTTRSNPSKSRKMDLYHHLQTRSTRRSRRSRVRTRSSHVTRPRTPTNCWLFSSLRRYRHHYHDARPSARGPTPIHQY